ncbi:MAG: SufB/SufD family protein [Christensenellales bacterium]
MNAVLKRILQKVSGLLDIPQGAYNFRVNGQSVHYASSENTRIIAKKDKPGMDIIVRSSVRGEVVHIPVLINQGGLSDRVYNDFYIGEGSEVHILAGCGMHNDSQHMTQHSGIHVFHVGRGARVKYDEKHYGQGEGSGDKVLNPETIIYLAEDSQLEMDSVQIEGVDNTKRITKATIGDNASLIAKEVILTTGTQSAATDFRIELDGKKSSVSIVSRSVAKGDSKQVFYSIINGNNQCKGHSACDAIIMDRAIVKAVPDVTAKHVDAELIHEAAIGKIAGEQITKLMSLGLNYEAAEQEIIAAFLR